MFSDSARKQTGKGIRTSHKKDALQIQYRPGLHVAERRKLAALQVKQVIYKHANNVKTY